MTQILNIPPSVPKDLVDGSGTKFKFTKAERKENVQTQLGKLSIALTVEGNLGNDSNNTYSYIFGLDKDQISGSVGRILSRFGFTDTDKVTNAALKEKLVGQTATIKKRGDKLYWY